MSILPKTCQIVSKSLQCEETIAGMLCITDILTIKRDMHPVLIHKNPVDVIKMQSLKIQRLNIS